MKILHTTLRMFKRFKLHAFINLFGLYLGLLCSIVIILFVRFHFSFDNFYADKDHIFRVSEIAISPDGTEISPAVRIPVGPDLQDAFAEIESFVHVGVQSHEYLLKFNQSVTTIHKTLYTSSNFFTFFSFTPVLGNVNDFLISDNSIVITEGVSQKLFGKINPLGQHVISNNVDYIVSGVVKSPPLNSHIQFDAVTSINPVIHQPDVFLSWDGGLSVPTFIKLKKSTERENVEAKIPDLVWEKVNKKNDGSGFSTQLFLEPITKIHAKSKVEWDPFSHKEEKGLLTLLSIGIVVLIIALINFMFLTHGILQLRIKEFGIKCYLGLNKKGIVKQLFIENSLLFMGATLLALITLNIIAPAISNLFDSPFIYFQLKHDLVFAIAGIVLLIFGSTGFQYIFLRRNLAKTKTLSHFKSVETGQKPLWITTLQFAASIALIVCIIVIYKQLNFIFHKDLGFKTENIINISHDGIGKKQHVFRNEFSKIPGVSSVSASFGIPGLETTQNGYLPQGSDQWLLFNALYVDDNFFNTFDLELVRGRGFKKGDDMDINSIIINETLAKQLGWDDPVGKTIFRNQDLTIIGVAKDFHVALMYTKVPPLVISKQWKPWFYTLNILVNTQNLDETLNLLKQKWQEIMPNTPFNYTFLDQRFHDLYKDVKRTATILIVFAFISILISVMGLFALTVQVLNNKVKEIGIRKVNGATIQEMLLWLNKNFLIWVVLAFIIAAPASYWGIQKWLNQFAYKTTLNWWIFALAGLLALVIALLTVSWQTYRAARRNPVEALRYE